MRNFFKISTIKARLLIIILTMLVSSLGILAGLSYYFSRQLLLNSTDEMAMEVGMDYSQRVEAAINSHVIELTDLASTPQMRSGDKKLMVEVMAEAHARLKVFEMMGFIDPDGSLLRYTGTSGTNLKDRDYFIQTLNSKQPFVSDPIFTPLTGQMAIMIAVPVIRDGSVIGVLYGNFPLEKQLNLIVKDLKFKDTGYGYVADKSGIVLAHPHRPELIGKLNLAEQSINPELQLPVKQLDQQLVALFKDAAAKNQQVKGSYTFIDGVTSFAVCTPITLPGGQQWILLINAPETEVMQAVQTLSRDMFGISLLCLLVAAAAVILLSKKFASPIIKMRDEALLLADGNIKSRAIDIDSADEIGQLARAFRKMTENLRGVVANVQTQAELVAGSSNDMSIGAEQSSQAANQVTTAITQIAHGADEQVVAVNTMLVMAEEISSNIVQVAKNSQSILASANNTKQIAEQGQDIIGQAAEHIKTIASKSKAVETAVGDLERGAQGISEIVNLIADFAEQTNLLALNAAIEAARAGEQGRGFAVVAEEIRKLASGSGKAAQEIREIVGNNGKEISNVIAAMEDNHQVVKEGIDVVGQAGENFKCIAESVFSLTTQIQVISGSIEKITSNSKGMEKSVQNIANISKSNTSEAQTVSAASEEQLAFMEEFASTSRQLAQAAAELRVAVEKFQV